jgi:hypothetical protein
VGLLSTADLWSQSDPRAPKPERPTVATHAWTVAPGVFELETGVEWDINSDHTHTLSLPNLLKIGVARQAQLGVQTVVNRPAGGALGPGDVALLLKYRVADRLPVLGAFAVIPGLKLPVGDQLHGTTTTDVSLLLISSHQLGIVALDVNLGYTRRSGDGVQVPKDATVWTVSTGFPLVRAIGMAAEVFGYPATSGPAGAPSSIALLAGPTIAFLPQAVFDVGAILRLEGPQPNALYAGMVYQLGRVR